MKEHINCIIGEGSKLVGDYDINGVLRIDGYFKGNVRSTGRVLVGEKGVAECDIIANELIIGGVYKGNIVATNYVKLLSTSHILGDIQSPRLIMEEDAFYEGHLKIGVMPKVDIEAMISKKININDEIKKLSSSEKSESHDNNSKTIQFKEKAAKTADDKKLRHVK